MSGDMHQARSCAQTLQLLLQADKSAILCQSGFFRSRRTHKTQNQQAEGCEYRKEMRDDSGSSAKVHRFLNSNRFLNAAIGSAYFPKKSAELSSIAGELGI